MNVLIALAIIATVVVVGLVILIYFDRKNKKELLKIGREANLIDIHESLLLKLRSEDYVAFIYELEKLPKEVLDNYSIIELIKQKFISCSNSKKRLIEVIKAINGMKSLKERTNNIFISACQANTQIYWVNIYCTAVSESDNSFMEKLAALFNQFESDYKRTVLSMIVVQINGEKGTWHIVERLNIMLDEDFKRVRNRM